MRWRRREEPWGSHHVEARALKWETSVGFTEVVYEAAFALGLGEGEEDVVRGRNWN